MRVFCFLLVLLPLIFAGPKPRRKNPCAGCVLPPVKYEGYPLECRPDEEASVSLKMVADKKKCRLVPSGCSIGYLYALDDHCAMADSSGPLPDVECVNGEFLYVDVPGFTKKVEYVVGGCSVYV